MQVTQLAPPMTRDFNDTDTNIWKHQLGQVQT